MRIPLSGVSGNLRRTCTSLLREWCLWLWSGARFLLFAVSTPPPPPPPPRPPPAVRRLLPVPTVRRPLFATRYSPPTLHGPPPRSAARRSPFAACCLCLLFAARRLPFAARCLSPATTVRHPLFAARPLPPATTARRPPLVIRYSPPATLRPLLSARYSPPATAARYSPSAGTARHHSSPPANSRCAGRFLSGKPVFVRICAESVAYVCQKEINVILFGFRRCRNGIFVYICTNKQR